MHTRRHILTSALFAPIFLLAADRVDPVNHDRKGIAIRGYDPVAYFLDGRPVRGNAQFTHAWNGATWQFASAAHREAFAKEPAKFAPQFGGYCSWAVSENYTAEIDPEAWRIIEGRLYLNYSKSIQEKWAAEVERRIAAGQKNWPGLHR
jgi:YHS domain-containing protein